MSSRKRPHPARRARAITGATSVGAALAMSGFLAVHASSTTGSATVTATAPPTAPTTVAAAQAGTPAVVATTRSAGS